MSAYVHPDRDGSPIVPRDALFGSDAELQALIFEDPSLLAGEIVKAGVASDEVDLSGDLRISLKPPGPRNVREKVLTAQHGVIETGGLMEAPSGFAV
jgi:hypothetical protein